MKILFRQENLCVWSEAGTEARIMNGTEARRRDKGRERDMDRANGGEGDKYRGSAEGETGTGADAGTKT